MYNIELVYPIVILQIEKGWIQKLKQLYILDPCVTKLIKQIEENNILGENVVKLLFEYENRILYIKPNAIHTRKRPVIFKTMESEVYSYVYN